MNAGTLKEEGAALSRPDRLKGSCATRAPRSVIASRESLAPFRQNGATAGLAASGRLACQLRRSQNAVTARTVAG